MLFLFFLWKFQISFLTLLVLAFLNLFYDLRDGKKDKNLTPDTFTLHQIKIEATVNSFTLSLLLDLQILYLWCNCRSSCCRYGTL